MSAGKNSFALHKMTAVRTISPVLFLAGRHPDQLQPRPRSGRGRPRGVPEGEPHVPRRPGRV
jgi:hypothetical protein